MELAVGQLFLQLDEQRKERFQVKEEILEHKMQPAAERMKHMRRQPPCAPHLRLQGSPRVPEEVRGTVVSMQDQCLVDL